MEPSELSRETVREMAGAMGLELSEERLDTLTERLSNFLSDFEEIYRIDTERYQAPGITYDRESPE